jgi:hypothetical protein
MDLMTADELGMETEAPKLAAITGLDEAFVAAALGWLATESVQALGATAVVIGVSGSYTDDNHNTHGQTAWISIMRGDSYVADEILDEVPGTRKLERMVRERFASSDNDSVFDSEESGSITIMPGLAVVARDESGEGDEIKQLMYLGGQTSLDLTAEATAILREACEGMAIGQIAVLAFAEEDDAELHDQMTATSRAAGLALLAADTAMATRWKSGTLAAVRLSDGSLAILSGPWSDSGRPGHIVGLEAFSKRTAAIRQQAA